MQSASKTELRKDLFSTVPWEVLVNIFEHCEASDLARVGATSSVYHRLVSVGLESLWVDLYEDTFNKKQSYPGSAYLAFARKAMTRVLRSTFDQVDIVVAGTDPLRALCLATSAEYFFKPKTIFAAYGSGRVLTCEYHSLLAQAGLGSARNIKVASKPNVVEKLQSLKREFERKERCKALKSVHGNKLLRLKFPPRTDDVFALWDDSEGQVDVGDEDVPPVDDDDAASDSSSVISSPRGSVSDPEDAAASAVGMSTPIGIRGTVGRINSKNTLATSPIVASLSCSPTSPLLLGSSGSAGTYLGMPPLSLSAGKSKKKMKREEKLRRKAALKEKRRSYVSKKAKRRPLIKDSKPSPVSSASKSGKQTSPTYPNERNLGRRAKRALRRKKMDAMIRRRERFAGEDNESISSLSDTDESSVDGKGDATEIMTSTSCTYMQVDDGSLCADARPSKSSKSGDTIRSFVAISDGTHALYSTGSKTVDMGMEAKKGGAWREGRLCPSCVSFLRQGGVVTGYASGAIALWSAEGTYECTYVASNSGIVQMASRGDTVALVDNDGNVASWRENQGTLRRLNKMRPCMAGQCTSVLLTEFLVVTCNDAGSLYAWSRNNGTLLKKHDLHEAAISCIDHVESHFASENNTKSSFARIVTGSMDSCVALVKVGVKRSSDNAQSQERGQKKSGNVKILRGHKGPVRQVHIDALKAVSCSDDGSIKIWDLQHGHKGRVVRTLRWKGARVPIVALAVGAREIVGGGADGSVVCFTFNSFFHASSGTCKPRLAWQSVGKKGKKSVKVLPFTPSSSSSRSDRRSLRDLKAWCNRAENYDDFDEDYEPPTPERRRHAGQAASTFASAFDSHLAQALDAQENDELNLQIALALSMEDL